MATNTKGDTLTMLKLEKNKSTTGYAAKMSSLLNFLNITSNIRTGAEVVETNISIGQNGCIIPLVEVKSNYVSHKMSAVKFYVKEENELYGSINEINRQIFELKKIIISKAKANTDEKKEKLQKKIDELQIEKDKNQASLNDLRREIEKLKAAEKEKLEATDFPIQEIRKELKLITGCKIRIDLTTGSYTFPVPVDTPFYRDVCNVLGLTPPTKEASKKQAIRMFTFNSDILTAIKKALKFISLDNLRPAMTGVQLEINNKKLTVVATDAHRLFQSRLFDVYGPNGSYSYLIPASALKKFPKDVKEDFVLHELKNGKISIFDMEIDLIDAKFPNWKVVMPTNYKGYVTFDRKEMITATKEVSVYSNKSTTQVNFSFNGEIELSSQDVDFSFESRRRLRYNKKTMDDLLIAFNGKLMVESLNAFTTNEVTLKAVSPTKAGIITDGNDTVLLMPLMLNS